MRASEHVAVFAAPIALKTELLAVGNDAAVWAASAAQQPRVWVVTAEAAVDSADPDGRAAAFATKFKDVGMRKGGFAQDFLDAVVTTGAPAAGPGIL